MMKRRSIIGWIIFFVLILRITPAISQDSSQKPRKDKGEQMKELIKAADVPINFYGKVIDQNGKSVEDAQVIVHLRHFDPNVALWLMATKEIILKTKNNGNFDVINEKGSHLFVDKVEKKGYEFTYDSNTKRGFEYSADLEKDRFKPDPANPVIFKMRKKESPAFVIPGQFSLNLGKEIIEKELDLVKRSLTEVGKLGTRKWAKDEHADLRIKVQQSKDQSNYTVTFTTPDSQSGITEKDGLFYVAPTEGYEATKIITIPIPTKMKKYLYVKSRQGGAYARLDTEINADKEGVHIAIKSWTNPNGSTNVDFDEEYYGQERRRKKEEADRKAIEREERKKLKQQK